MFDVFLHDVRVGALAPRGRGIRFTYAAEALADDALAALSLSLPKRPDPFPDSLAGPFFRNLLPEQAFRRLVAAEVGTAPENSLALLGAIGGECPGAVSIWPAGSGPPARPEYEPLDTRALAALFDSAHRPSLMGALRRGRLSLAGAQEKVALLRDPDGRWFRPLNGAVTSHILKQPSADFPHILENELFCTTLARDAGLDVPALGLADPQVRVFCTERFDRTRGSSPAGPPRGRLHQEDFCQILRVEPDRKYETDGGPGLRQCATVIQRHAALPARDLLRLVRWAGFNYLIGNEDAHAKNLALLHGPQGLVLSPHYDLVSTAVYPDLVRRLAMKLGRSWDIRNVQRSDWERLAGGAGVPWSQARHALQALAAAVAASLSGTQAACRDAYGASPVYDQIVAIVMRQVASVERELR
jgi:serine/threonine-protein kinase HipA